MALPHARRRITISDRLQYKTNAGERVDQNFFKGILDNLYDGVYFVDRERRITYWNYGAERISGFCADEVLGKCCAESLLKHISPAGDELCHGQCPLNKTLTDGIPREAEVFLHHKNGHRVPVCVRISPLQSETEGIIGAVEVFSDTTSRLRIQSELDELKHQTQADPLTGLANRRGAAMEFNRRRDALRRYRVPFGLLFVDIDNFKLVNDSYGHDVGDRVLIAVGKTLQSATRNVDAVCRWGGEEFLAFVPKVDPAAFRSIAERMRRFVEVSPIPTCHGPLSITVSVGGVMAMAQDSLESLAARADAMMYKAKQAGRNCAVLDCDMAMGLGEA